MCPAFTTCADFVRLLKDPAATHIELKGNLVFSPDHFPPENAHDQSKGINVTHRVSCMLATTWVLIAWALAPTVQQYRGHSRSQQQSHAPFMPSEAAQSQLPAIAVAAVMGWLQVDDVRAVSGCQLLLKSLLRSCRARSQAVGYCSHLAKLFAAVCCLCAG
jgi:hypothetical protein